MRKRGRPLTKDKLGENYLENTMAQAKIRHLLNIDCEPIDLCYKYALIDSQQLKFAIRFRWLYSLLYGSPNLRSNMLQHFDDEVCVKVREESWLLEKKKEYSFVVATLIEHNPAYLELVKSICVYNHMPHSIGIYINDMLNNAQDKRRQASNNSAIEQGYFNNIKSEINDIEAAMEVMRAGFINWRKKLFYQLRKQRCRVRPYEI